MIITFFLILVSSNDYIIEKTSITADESDLFLPVRYNDGFLISIRESEKSFYKLYYAKKRASNQFDQPIPIVHSGFPRLFNISPGTIVNTTGEFYFTANSRLKGAEGIIGLGIYSGEIINNELKRVELLNLGMNSDSYAHPTVSPSGLRMILSRDRDNQIDLIEYERDSLIGKWTLKRELKELNSSQMDSFPFFINDSLLVFSTYVLKPSKNLDLFSSKLNENGTWSVPISLDYLNTEHDDFGVNTIDFEKGYFSSNRDGNDQIYYFEKKKN